MPNPALDELNDPARFRLLAEVSHQELAAFVGQFYWRKKSWVTVAHYLFSLGVLTAWIWAGRQPPRPFDHWLATFGDAVLCCFALMPLHEGIHGAVYALCGARDIRFGGSLRQFCVYALAHRFVAGRRDFAWVAVTPFLVINGLLLAAAVVFPTHRFFLIAALLIHTAGTSGDFAMLNFLWLNRTDNVYTYDDADAKKSFFYQRVKASGNGKNVPVH